MIFFPCVRRTIRLWVLAIFACVAAAFASTVAWAQHGEPIPGQILVQFQPWVGQQQREQVFQQTETVPLRAIEPIGVHVLRTPDGVSEQVKVQQLRNRAEVVFAEVDQLVQPDDTAPNDPQYGLQWHLPTIKSPGAWAHTTGDEQIIIAILDSGIDANHSDLNTKLVPGWDVWYDTANTSDLSGHGTKVAGTAAAATHNSTGVAGVAWDCRIMPVRITNTNGYASLSTIASGLVWAANNGARVANVSYSAWSSGTVMAAAEYFQTTSNGVVTMSAGNQGTFYSTASSPYLIAVSATTATDGLASFTNSGNYVDIAAPGVSIRSTLNGGGYGNSSGTSFAAPIVAGVAGLVLSVNPSLSGEELRNILLATADDFGPKGWDPGYGWGRVNAKAAVTLALGQYDDPGTSDPGDDPATDDDDPVDEPPDTEPPTITIVSPSNGDAVSGHVTVLVDASDNVGVTLVELYVNGALSSSQTSPPFSTRLNTNPLPSGDHTLQVRAYDAAGNVGVSSTVTVNKPDGGGGGGGGGGQGKGGGKGGGKK